MRFGEQQLGGPGVLATSAAITNSGSITGTGANAITFTGCTNVLQLQPGSVITGNVVGTGGKVQFTTFSPSLSLLSSSYTGFGTFKKIGSGTFTISGIELHPVLTGHRP